MGVTFTNTKEPTPQRVFKQEVVSVATPASYGIAEVTEATKLVPMAAIQSFDQWGNPRPYKAK